MEIISNGWVVVWVGEEVFTIKFLTECMNPNWNFQRRAGAETKKLFFWGVFGCYY